MSRSDDLGTRRQVSLAGGTISYRETGTGPTIVFVHGVFVNGDLWRHVVPPVAAAGFRCITPDWPFGSQDTPMAPDADLSPPGIARLICEFLAALDLNDVTLVANDTGGAFTQLAVVHDRSRIGRLVLTPSDSLECFFPPMFRYLELIAKLPGSAMLIAQSLRLTPLHRLPLVFGWLSKRPIPAAAMASYLEPMQRSSAIRRDLAKVIRGVDKRFTMAAATHFPNVNIPVLLAWSAEDRLFPIRLADRLAELFPDARVAPIADSYTFVPEDRPEELVKLVTEFARPAT